MADCRILRNELTLVERIILNALGQPEFRNWRPFSGFFAFGLGASV
jgi:hypothetical protein